MKPARPALVLFLALALIPFVARFGPQAYILSLGAHALVFAISALSLDFMLGQGALVSFGHAAFLGIGAYVVVISSSLGYEDILIQFVIAAVAATAFAALTSAISLRASGVYYIMSTLAFGQMLYFLATSLSVYGGDDGVTLSNRSRLLGSHILDGDIALYYFALVFLVACYAGLLAVAGSRYGRVLNAIRQNPLRVQALGLRPMAFRLTATLISGAICACAGVLLANQSEFVSPAFMTWQRSGELLVMVLLGGVGSLWGAILGAIAFLMLEEALSNLTEQWALIMGPLLIVVAMIGRGGIAGLFARRLDGARS